MAKSKTKRDRIKQQREGALNPEIHRQQWHRKPQTQIVRNEKAEQRRRACRKGTMDDAVFVSVAITMKKGNTHFRELMFSMKNSCV